MKRRAPADGYDFGNKRQYRRTIWKRFREHCGTRRAEAHALLLPSSEGDEIDVALANGFREENLHVVDRNAAIVAHLKRRFPKVHTYGAELPTAIRRIAADGYKLSVANVDLCSNITGPTFVETLGAVQEYGAAFVDGALLALTMLRGRERYGFSKALKCGVKFPQHFFPELPDGDRFRCAFPSVLMTSQGCLVLPKSATDVGVYRSAAGSQTMLWCIYRFVRRDATVSSDAESRFASARPLSHDEYRTMN